MKATPKEEARALRLLKKCRIEPEEIERFSFMQRYTMPQSGDKPEKVVYGPGIMVLHLKDGNNRLLPPSFSHPTSMVHYLLSLGIPFDNYQEGLTPDGDIRPTVYKRPSLYKFYFSCCSSPSSYWAITSALSSGGALPWLLSVSASACSSSACC